MTSLVIPKRFCGPDDSANGGWAAGSVGQHLSGASRVTLRKPIPLDTELTVAHVEDRVVMTHGDVLIAEAEARAPQLEVPDPVSWADATAATERFRWKDNHVYPRCFVCGPDRADTGLRIFPGAVEGRSVSAAPWTVPADLCEDNAARIELVWAALDCPSWFGFADVHGPTTPKMLLGQLTVDIARLPRAAERCVVGGFPGHQEGRKIMCGSALWSEDGELLAHSEALWIALKG